MATKYDFMDPADPRNRCGCMTLVLLVVVLALLVVVTNGGDGSLYTRTKRAAEAFIVEFQNEVAR